MRDPSLAPTELLLYLPHPESELARILIVGSAIVGNPDTDGPIHIYFEGNSIGAPKLAAYRDRVSRAADHLLFNYPVGYPTKAKRLVEPREVEAIGTFDVSSRRIAISRPAAELSWWISASDLVDLGLITPAH